MNLEFIQSQIIKRKKNFLAPSEKQTVIRKSDYILHRTLMKSYLNNKKYHKIYCVYLSNKAIWVNSS